MEVFKSIFGPSTGTSSLFSSSNAFRKQEEEAPADGSPGGDSTGINSKPAKKKTQITEHQNPIKKNKKKQGELTPEPTGNAKVNESQSHEPGGEITLNGHDDTVSGSKHRNTKHSKRACEEESEHKKPTKKKKVGIEDVREKLGSRKEGSSNPSGVEGGPDALAMGSKKRKKDDSVEARYEKRLRALDNPSSIQDIELESKPMMSKEDVSKVEEAGAPSKKRKRHDSEVEPPPITEDPKTVMFDDEEKLKRTVFVGNLPLNIRKKAIIKEFSQYGPVESARLRSVPLLDTKIPRKGAIIKGKINEAVNSQNGYVVFKDAAHATAALSHNMKEFNGNHIRVDSAHAPNKLKPSFAYDRTRSIFIGNLPFDVKDEELYQLFSKDGQSPDLDVEAIRVVRDPTTSLSKGIAFVLFKTKAGSNQVLARKHNVILRDRKLRVSRVVALDNSQDRTKGTKRAAKMDDGSHLHRKRAKLSASYEGVRATKDGSRPAKGLNKASQNGKGRHSSNNSFAGAKRKRTEKKQRGISRSKKIRRT